jgi:ribosomal protein L22
LRASKKVCSYICKFIKNKEIDKAISDLELVIKKKKPVPFKGEIPHRKGKIMSGRYPEKASKLFIGLLKGLKGNAVQNGLELEKTRIYIASASWSARPARRGNVRAKRTNVILRAKEVTKETKKKEDKK